MKYQEGAAQKAASSFFKGLRVLQDKNRQNNSRLITEK